MFINSLWDVKEPTQYSRRVKDEVPGVVTVLCECALSRRRGRPGSDVLKGLWCMKPPKQKQPQGKKGLCWVLEHVDVDVDETA